MAHQSAEQLVVKHCLPCEGGIAALSPDEASSLLETLSGWELTSDQKRIRKEWLVKDFIAAMNFFHRIAELSEAEGHHPDLHLSGYRNVSIEIGTHAIDGLSENDFILAAKIDTIPIELKRKPRAAVA